MGTSLADTKTEYSEAPVAIDAGTVDVLREHRVRQEREKAAAKAWVDSGLVFIEPDGATLHPADVTDLSHELTRQAGPQPIRLHDLRHGAATLALAAGWR